VILTNNVRHFAPVRLAESGLLVHTAESFVPQWWLDPRSVEDILAEMAGQPAGHSTIPQVLESLRRFAPEFVILVETGTLK
jgi:hypothetical protein